MYAGEIVEIGKAANVISYPKHPYTFDLLHSLPGYEEVIKGEITWKTKLMKK